jgi:hypothetical protein
VRSLSEICGLRVSKETNVAPKGPVQSKRCKRFGHTQRNCGYAPRCVACGETHLSGDCSNPKQQLKCCSCRGNHTANYRGCSKWKEANRRLQTSALQGTRTSGDAVQPASNRVVPPQPSAEEKSLGSSCNHVVRGGCVVNAALPTLPEPAPTSVKEVLQKNKMTQLSTGSNAANPVLKATKAFRQAQVTSTKVKSGKSSPNNLNPTKLILPPQSVKSPVEENSDLLDTFPLGACVELTRRIVTAAPNPTLGGPLERRPPNRCPLCSRIWQQGLE